MAVSASACRSDDTMVLLGCKDSARWTCDLKRSIANGPTAFLGLGNCQKEEERKGEEGREYSSTIERYERQFQMYMRT
jgi:hypothetical protein